MVTAGEVIKRKRESLGKDINTVSIDTKIQRRFLEYIEKDQFDKFDSQIFASGFLKIYSKYLGLDVEKILALYRRSTMQEAKIKESKSSKKKKVNRIHISPKLLGIVTITLFLLLIVGYVGFQIYKFQTPPSLTIIRPTDEYVSDTESVLLEGITQPSTLISVNDSTVQVDMEGNFKTEITLSEGVNTVNIKARKNSNSNLVSSKTLKVIYAPVIPQQKQESNEFLLTLSINQSPSWVKLDIDNENKISQVLQPNTVHEFNVSEQFTLVTGRVQNTTLEVNGESISLTASNLTGIAQVTCNIVENQLQCE
jgi:cytoskeletal protein RodZ